MPEKFTFPTIEQAMALQKAENMEEIKITLRNWWNQNPHLRISENVAWSFKISPSESLIRRYIHCKFCSAKICYTKIINNQEDKQLGIFKISKFYLHHDHRLIESVRQNGKMKTFPQDYPKIPTYNRFSKEKQRKQYRNKLRKRREEEYRYKKLELYYRLNMMIKEQDKSLVNIKQLTARSLDTTVQRFMNFLNSPARGNVEVSAIKKLLKRAGFEKYSVQMESSTKGQSGMVKTEDGSHRQNEGEFQRQTSEEKSKSKNENLIVEQSKDYFKKLMIFVNYNEIAKKNLQHSEGFINISHLNSKVISKKFMTNMKWDVLLLYSHDQNFIPNQLYGIIMIESSRFNIKQIKKSFEITFKLLNPLKKLHFQCCIHQENIYIMGALDLIIEQTGQKTNQNSGSQSCLSISYFLSPKLSTEIINKCEFIPKIFRKKLIDKIYELDPEEIDGQFQKIITELQKASQIKEFKAKTEEYLAELKEFHENFHKIFLGKFKNPSFVSLIFTNYKNLQDDFDLSMDDLLTKKLSQYSEGNKYFLEFLILIFEVFKQPGGSFIYKRHQGETRQSTKVEEIYVNNLVFPQHQYFDEVKKFYNLKAFRGKFQKPKTPETKKENADFFQEFSAILYERIYKIREIFMKVSPEVLTVLIRQIQKSFTLQVQTKSIEQIKLDGTIRVKELNKLPNTVKILNLSRFWSTDNNNSTAINLVESETDVIELEQTENPKKKKESYKKSIIKRLWECDCNWSKFTLLPCSHEIRCCLTFFTSLEDQMHDFWLFDPRILELMEEDDNKSEVLTEDGDNSEKQNNSQSD